MNPPKTETWIPKNPRTYTAQMFGDSLRIGYFPMIYTVRLGTAERTRAAMLWVRQNGVSCDSRAVSRLMRNF